MRVRAAASLAVSVVLLLGVALTAGPSSAGSRLPRHAVAQLLARTSLDHAGYQSVRPSCSTCLSSPSYTADDWAEPHLYQLGTDPSGRLVVASLVKQDVIKVKRFDPQSFALVSSGRIVLSAQRFSLETVFLGQDGNLYALLTRHAANKRQRAGFVVGKVQKFGPDLSNLGTAKITSEAADSHGVWKLARWGQSSMLLRGSLLILHTSRTIYAGSDGVHHEVDLTVAIDTAAMTVLPRTGDFAWVSHSFNQLVGAAGSSLVLVDHGDAYPRAITVTVERRYLRTDTIGASREFEPLKIWGADGDNFTGATVNSVQTGAGRVLLAGISVPQGHRLHGVRGISSHYSPNVYVTSTDLKTGGNKFHWLTRFNPTSAPRTWVGQPAIVKLSSRRFAVLYSVATPTSRVMRYSLVSARGRVLAHERWKGFGFDALSSPQLIGSRLFWVGFHARRGATRGKHLLYCMDVTDPANPVLVR